MRHAAHLALSGLVVMLSACGGGSTSPSNNNNNNGNNSGGGNGLSVDVLDYKFSPDSIAVSAGATVTWTWGGYATHNVTFSDLHVGDSGDMVSGSFSKAFPTAGTYLYRCTHHAGMSGKVVVQ